MKIQYHCQCQSCGGISVFEREAKYPGDLPQVHIPFSLSDNSFKCAGCGIVWAVEIELINLTKEYGPDIEGEMPKVEGVSSIGRVKDVGGGLSIG